MEEKAKEAVKYNNTFLLQSLIFLYKMLNTSIVSPSEKYRGRYSSMFTYLSKSYTGEHVS